MVMRLFSPRCSIRVMRPTSSTIPVNIKTSCGNCSLYALRVASGGAHCQATFGLILVGIAQVAFYGEVFAEAVQVKILHLRCLAHVAKAGPGCEGNRAGFGQGILGGGLKKKTIFFYFSFLFVAS